ncbi:MAG: L-threonylcarbamoyladenylate synthase [Angelakisella sp.]|nr:L-threonylcarbamoyladenylate synthase [Angelakisella sp.]
MERQTVLLSATDAQSGQKAILEAGRILAEGGLVAIPTETVYGLAADATNEKAVANIFAAKGRPQDNPLIVHISAMEEIYSIVKELPTGLTQLATHFWPGPLTIICPKSEDIPMVTSGGLDTVAVRMPSHPVARDIIRAAGVPLAAPSANRSGSPSPTTAQHCVNDLWGRVEAIVDSGPCDVGVESTVISLCGSVPTLLRPGAVTLEQLREVLGEVELGKGVLEQLEEGTKVLSPGLKYKHYAPAAKVVLVRGNSEAFAQLVQSKTNEGVWAMCFTEDKALLQDIPNLCYGAAEDYAAQAVHLFDHLRKMDELGAKEVYIHAPKPEGIGLAVYNRLVRSAGFCIIDV